MVAEQRRGETTAAVVATNASGEIVSGVGLPMVSVASAAEQGCARVGRIGCCGGDKDERAPRKWRRVWGWP